jgi:hypothetical protein
MCVSRANVIEVAEVKTTPRFEVGDKVRITACLYGHKFEIGDTVEVKRVTTNDGEYLVSKDRETWFVRDNELEPVEAPQETASRFKVGDEVRIVDNTVNHKFPFGEIVRINSWGEGTDELGNRFGVGTAEYLDGRDFWAVTLNDIEEVESPVETTLIEVAPKYDVGQLVRVIGEESAFDAGEIVRITRVDEADGYRAEYLDGSDYWWVSEDEIEPFDGQFPALREGQLVEVIRSDYFDASEGMIVGDVGRLSYIDHDDESVPYRVELLDGSDYEWFRPDQLRGLTDLEIAALENEGGESFVQFTIKVFAVALLVAGLFGILAALLS